jgi:NAD(P)H-hydrate epimerase
MVRVTTAAQASAIDQRAIAGGTASYVLMTAAGRAAATVLRDRYADEVSRGVLIFAGPGNNGGDGYVVAGELAAAGVDVSVVSFGEPRSDDAKRARSELPASVRVHAWADGPADSRAKRIKGAVLVDALLGTGASGAPRESIAEGIESMRLARAAGMPVVAMDVPSGVDATTGATSGSVAGADLTITFGTLKRGLLRNRDASGAIVAVDIELGAAADDESAPTLVDAARALDAVPAIGAAAHKGTRRRLLIIGGAPGMLGAAILSARGALRSGIGMVKVCAHPDGLDAIQSAEPAVLTAPWPESDAALQDLLAWAHGVLIGPGLGLSDAQQSLASRVLSAWRGPIVVDADALSAFAGNAEALGALLTGRPALITPHAVEAERLVGLKSADLDAGRFDSAAFIASRARCAVLLKGVPTVVTDARRTLVVAAGTPVLGTAGSGDVLAGIAATLLAQTGDALASGATAAWVHGRAAEIAGHGAVRGVALDDVVAALRHAWMRPAPLDAPVLADLPAVGTRP